jgi:mono/diheme cytochrome c family protein
MRWRSVWLMVALGTVCAALVVSCAGSGRAGGVSVNPAASSAQEPDVPVAARTVWAGTYSRDIQPIFTQNCVSCHGDARAENGLRLDSYQAVMKGTQHGPVVAPTSPSASALVSVIDGSASSQILMPHQGRKLTPNRIENIKLWIQAGAPND